MFIQPNNLIFYGNDFDDQMMFLRKSEISAAYWVGLDWNVPRLYCHRCHYPLCTWCDAPLVTRDRASWLRDAPRDSWRQAGAAFISARREQSQSPSDSAGDNFAASDLSHLICHEAPQPGLCGPGAVPVGPTLTLSGLCQLFCLWDVENLDKIKFKVKIFFNK